MSKPKKNFGQNFLIDQIVLGRIIDALSLVNGEQVLEIGCGKGALTERMLMKGINLKGVEIDRDLIDAKMLNDNEIEWINEYHQKVFQKLSNFLTLEEKRWLHEVTMPLKI